MLMPANQARFFAGLKRADALVDRQAPLIKAACALLEKEGHAVLAASVAPGRPVIQIAGSPHLADLIKTGRAAYYMRGYDDQGHFRRGQLLSYRNVLVTWEERGN